MERKGPSFSIPSHYSFVLLSSLSVNRLSCLFQFGHNAFKSQHSYGLSGKLVKLGQLVIGLTKSESKYL